VVMLSDPRLKIGATAQGPRPSQRLPGPPHTTAPLIRATELGCAEGHQPSRPQEAQVPPPMSEQVLSPTDGCSSSRAQQSVAHSRLRTEAQKDYRQSSPTAPTRW